MRAALGGRRPALCGRGRDAGLGRGSRAGRNGAEIQGAAYGPHMKADINGARIHYRREGAGFPILMFHAGIADSRMWQPQADEFAKEFDVIRPDMRGFGDSELPPRRWSPVGDVIALIDELGLKPAHLIGCSLGGGLAMGGDSFGKKYPEVFAEVRAADEAKDFKALNEAEARLFLDGPRRSRGHVGGELRELFLDMNGRNVHIDFESAPADERDPP